LGRYGDPATEKNKKRRIQIGYVAGSRITAIIRKTGKETEVGHLFKGGSPEKWSTERKTRLFN